ncbi:4Fe-4S binding protein [Candidatus Magnetominusculus dajiuhuensis]|uniref:4Fe-4S binding protein n=1 Tax=Candidatus Magnetominusculus dajiuhuensis TaxID=3137712 RepID=UPI003B435D7A
MKAGMKRDKKLITLLNVRRVYSVFFFSLFLILLYITDFRHLKGYETPLLLELDPLVAVAAFFTSFTVYKGLALSLLIIIPTIFFGRFFCSWVCPFGILNQWISHLFNKRRAVDDYKTNAYRDLYRIKYYILAALVVLAIFGALQVGLFDPIALMTRSFTIGIYPAANYIAGGIYIRQPLFIGGLLVSVIFLLIVAGNRFITRFWCRVLCPLGAFMGVLSMASVLRIRRNVDKCTDCQRCLRYCHGGCEPHGQLRYSECHLCMTCVEQCPEGALHYGLSEEASSVHRPIDVNRRRLIETVVGAVVLFPIMRSAVNGANLPQSGLIRPPGSIEEGDFLRRCIKCGQCMRVCPTNVIQPALMEGGLEGLWTPVLQNKIGYCEYNCVLCGHVCPTGAIMPLTVEKKIGKKPDIKPTKIGTAFYDHGRCLPWSMNVDCIVCEEVCPTSPKAIWFKEEELRLRDGTVRKFKRPIVDTQLCVGCGICENKCPVHDKPAIRVTPIGETRSKTNRMILKG